MECKESASRDVDARLGLGGMISIYYAGFAIALYATLQSLPLSTSNYNKHVYRAYLFICGFTATFLFCTAGLLSAESLDAVASFAKWQSVSGFGFSTAFVWLMANYTETQYRPTVLAGLIGYTLLAFGGVVYSVSLPYGLFIEDVQILGKISVLGGDITHLSYEYRPQSAIFQIMGFMGIGWGAWCCRLLWTRGNRFASVLFASYLVFLTLAYSQQLLYNFGYLTVTLPGGITYLWFFVVVSLCFGRDHQVLTRELHRQSRELHAEVGRRREAELKFKHQAYTDELTGLPNQLELRQQLDELVMQGRPGSLMLIQVDRFREIKQVFGEETSDNILREIARRLALDMPDNRLVARVSDHCFAVIPQTNRAFDLARAEGVGKWHKGCYLILPYPVGRQSIEVTFSVGVVDLTAQDTVQAALYKVEHALEEATKHGPDSIVFYSEDFALKIARQQLLEGDLKRAVNNNELLLHYQPLVNQQKQMKGVEALLRWQHPDLGMIPPAEFIPLAERSGLITALGDWVLEAVCRDLVRWRNDNIPFRGRVSVNVSSWQLQTESFASSVLELLHRYEVSPEWLTLELTESALIDNVELTGKQLNLLRKAGIAIALDDFGTGFSSLAYLSRLPLDTLKIDKIFVDDVESERGRKLLAGMLDIGSALGLKVVLEGVETEAQFHILRSLDCQHFQGYLFSRPLPPADLQKWAQNNS